MAAGARRRARWFALQVLYALDLNPGVGVEVAIVDDTTTLATLTDDGGEVRLSPASLRARHDPEVFFKV